MKTFSRAVCKDELVEAIDQWVILSLGAERDRRILYRRLIDGAKEDTLCREFDLSEQRIAAIVDKWFDIIAEHLE